MSTNETHEVDPAQHTDATKRRKLLKRAENVAERSVTFSTPDGHVLYVARLDGLADDMVTRLALFGLSSKMGQKADVNDAPDALAADLEATWKQLAAGEWGGPGGAQRTPMLVEAVVAAGLAANAEAAQIGIERAKEAGKLAALELHPKVQKALAEIKRARKGLDRAATSELESLFS